MQLTRTSLINLTYKINLFIFWCCTLISIFSFMNEHRPKSSIVIDTHIHANKNHEH